MSNHTNPAAQATARIAESVTDVLARDHTGRRFKAPVAVLGLDAIVGLKRVWKSATGVGVIIRELHHLGPKGYRPIGYVAPGVVIAETGDAMSDTDRHVLGEYYASLTAEQLADFAHKDTLVVTRDIDPLQAAARITRSAPGDAPVEVFAVTKGTRTCTSCRQTSGNPHTATCRYAGTIVA